jgi:hypothetical protein
VSDELIDAADPVAAPSRGDLARTLGDVELFVRRYVVLTASQSVAIALWVAHTHAFEAADATPYLAITSAEKRSGKTRLLEVLELIVSRPWFTGRTTTAALTRKIDAVAPTLLLDESDAAFKGGQEYAETLRGVLNTGYRRGGKTTVCVVQGSSISYADLNTFSPKAIAGIGDLPDTVADRSIPIRLTRRALDEPVEKFRRRDAEDQAESTRQSLESLASHHMEELRDARPEEVGALDDRAADVWEPLLAIADLAGDAWPALARAAAVELSTGLEAEDASLGVELLTDVRRIFDSLGAEKISLKDLASKLAEIEEAQWGDMRGREITGRDVGRMLKPYRIRARSVRLGSERTARGFKREQFEDAWARYLRPPVPADDGLCPQGAREVPDAKTLSTRLAEPHVRDVPAKNHPPGESE